MFSPPWASLCATTTRQGFDCGDGTDDAIPSQFSTKTLIWDQQLANGLSNSTKSIQIHDLKSYPYIHQLIKSMNPAFVHRPSDLILQRQMQLKTESIQGFFLRTQDHLNLCGLILDNANDLDKEFELDSFISSFTHGTFLHQVLIHDRSVPSKQHKFTPDQIKGTITKYLQTKPSTQKPYTSYNNRHGNSSTDRKRHININTISEDIYPIEVGQDILKAALNVLQRSSSLLDQDCMICLTTNPEDADHKFNVCPILNNIEHLKRAYIKGCMAIRQALNLQKATHSNKLKAIINLQSISDSPFQDDPSPKDSAINQILSVIDEGIEKDF